MKKSRPKLLSLENRIEIPDLWLSVFPFPSHRHLPVGSLGETWHMNKHENFFFQPILGLRLTKVKLRSTVVQI